MNEAKLNLAIGKSLDWYYKIPDDGISLKFGGRRPFDGIGIINGFPVYWESKLLKSVSSFNFSRLKDHQLGSLIRIKTLCPRSFCLFLIGVYFSRKDFRLFYFDLEEISKRKIEKKSITKREFLELKNYCVYEKGVFPKLKEVLRYDV